MKLYAYCLAEGLDNIDTSQTGISGTPVRLLKIDELGVLVSDAELDAVSVTRENALAHAAVVRSVLDRTTPLPFRFGTLVTEEQLRSYLTTRKTSLKTKLSHVRGCVEMNVKIIQQLSENAQTQPQQVDQVVPESPGTAFLTQKRREILGDEHNAAQAAELSRFLRESLNGLIKDEQVVLRPSERLVLAAAHLVEQINIQPYREKMTEAIGNRPELHFMVSGPWPPYSFANIELEFKTHFGVT